MIVSPTTTSYVARKISNQNQNGDASERVVYADDPTSAHCGSRVIADNT